MQNEENKRHLRKQSPKAAAKKEYKNKSNTRNNMEEPKFTLVISKVLLVRLKSV